MDSICFQEKLFKENFIKDDKVVTPQAMEPQRQMQNQQQHQMPQQQQHVRSYVGVAAGARASDDVRLCMHCALCFCLVDI